MSDDEKGPIPSGPQVATRPSVLNGERAPSYGPRVADVKAWAEREIAHIVPGVRVVPVLDLQKLRGQEFSRFEPSGRATILIRAFYPLLADEPHGDRAALGDPALGGAAPSAQEAGAGKRGGWLMALAPDLAFEDDYWPELYGRTLPPAADPAGQIVSATVGGGRPPHIQRGRLPTKKGLRFHDRLRNAYRAWLMHGGQPADWEDWLGNEEVLEDWRAFRDRCLALPEWIVAGNQPCQVYNAHPEPDETVTWSGGCVDGKAEGRGELVYRLRSGVDRYEGEMHSGKPHGRGIYLWHNGERYDGEWRDGKYHGHGTYTDAGGGHYEGGWRHGKRHGWGVESRPDGLVWRGQWRDGLQHGTGTEISPDGCRFEGEWRDGWPHGPEQVTHPDGRRETIEAPQNPGLWIRPIPAG